MDQNVNEQDIRTELIRLERDLYDPEKEGVIRLPRVVCVGPSFIESKNFAVLNKHVIFPAESILHALDLCYKMIKSLPVITKSWKPRPFGNMIPHVWCILEYVMYDSNENLDLYVPVRDLLTKLNSADAS